MDGGGTGGGDNTDVCNGDGDGDKKGMAPTMAIFSLNAQCTGGRVSGGAGRRARWAGCLEH